MKTFNFRRTWTLSNERGDPMGVVGIIDAATPTIGLVLFGKDNASVGHTMDPGTFVLLAGALGQCARAVLDEVQRAAELAATKAAVP